VAGPFHFLQAAFRLLRYDDEHQKQTPYAMPATPPAFRSASRFRPPPFVLIWLRASSSFG